MTAGELRRRLSSAELMEYLAADALDAAERAAAEAEAGQRAELANLAESGLARVKRELRGG